MCGWVSSSTSLIIISRDEVSSRAISRALFVDNGKQRRPACVVSVDAEVDVFGKCVTEMLHRDGAQNSGLYVRERRVCGVWRFGCVGRAPFCPVIGDLVRHFLGSVAEVDGFGNFVKWGDVAETVRCKGLDRRGW